MSHYLLDISRCMSGIWKFHLFASQSLLRSSASMCFSCHRLRHRTGKCIPIGTAHLNRMCSTGNTQPKRPCSARLRQYSSLKPEAIHRHKKKSDDMITACQQLICVLEQHRYNMDQLRLCNESGKVVGSIERVKNLCASTEAVLGLRKQLVPHEKQEKLESYSDAEEKRLFNKRRRDESAQNNSVGYIVDMNSVAESVFRKLNTHSPVVGQDVSWESNLRSFKAQLKKIASTQLDTAIDKTMGDQLVKMDSMEEGSNASTLKLNDPETRQLPPTQNPQLITKPPESAQNIHEQIHLPKKPNKVKRKQMAKNLEDIISQPEFHAALNEFYDLETSEDVEPSILPVFTNEYGDDLEMEATAKDQLPVKVTKLTPRKGHIKKVRSSQDADRAALGRSHNFQEDLKSYIDVCIHAGLVKKAHATLCYLHRFTRNTSSGKDFSTANIDVYNMLLRGWAKKHNLERIQNLLDLLKVDGLTPNMQSFAAVLECLGRIKRCDEVLVRQCLHHMDSLNLNVKNIVNECWFQGDEKSYVVKAIKSVDPDFMLNPPPTGDRYNCALVDDLNDVNMVCENPFAGVIDSSSLRERADQQLYWEKRMFLSVNSIEQLPPPTDKTIEMREKLKMLHDEWKTSLLVSFNRKMESLNKRDHTLNMYPYVKLFKPEEYVELILQEIQLLATQSSSFSPVISVLWKRLAERAQRKYIIQDKLLNKHAEKVSEVYSEFTDVYNGQLTNHREAWLDIVHRHDAGTTLDVSEKHWPWHIIRSLGSFLYDIILYETKIDRNTLKTTGERHMIPAFYTVFRKNHKSLQMTEEVKPHPTLVTLYKEAGWKDLNFEVHELPMLVPPVPWTSVTYGGNLLGSTQLVRVNGMTQQQMIELKKLPNNQMNPVLDSLNVLTACPWKINKPVLDLVIDMFNNKGDKDLDIPPPVSECPPLPKLTLDMTSAEKSKLLRERMRLKQKQSEMYSLWCNELYKLSIANMFRDEIFWFPHNMDFRGRVYPCPPHFNHLGSDVTRSILLFAKGKPLGEHGLDWLKTHLINLTGLKKRSSNSERLAYANEVLPNIIDSAENPMLHDWWRQSDEPWQTLACCMEICNALQSDDPVAYISHFPVHQDGSCNGLQHYAALGRDQAGAESVNLHPFPVPQDVYSDVAELVEKIRVSDAENGHPIAKVLEGFVKRKVIKQTVMTTVYGVTRYGAKVQILRQLNDIPEFPQQHAWAASAYLTEKTFQSLQQMFTATKEIQDWFTACAQLICTVKGQPVQWVTPLGLPVIQPYHKSVMAAKGAMSMTNKNNMFEKPNAMKQKNAMPPNFIHSLDSTHMMLTALYCLTKGITFVSVHDCFWTHACDVDVMNQVIREQFIALHSEPILENLSQSLQQSVGLDSEESGLSADASQSMAFLRSVLAMVPSRGEFDLKSVLKSTYFFS